MRVHKEVFPITHASPILFLIISTHTFAVGCNKMVKWPRKTWPASTYFINSHPINKVLYAMCSTIDWIMPPSWIIHFIWHASSQNSNQAPGFYSLSVVVKQKFPRVPTASSEWRSEWWERPPWNSSPGRAGAGNGTAQSLLIMKSDRKDPPPGSHHHLISLNIMEPKEDLGCINTGLLQSSSSQPRVILLPKAMSGHIFDCHN